MAASGIASFWNKPGARRAWGWLLTVLPCLLFGLSAFLKLQGSPEVIKGFTHLGIPASMMMPLAILEITCVVIYLIPPTAVLGAILLTGYIGGAICAGIGIAASLPLFARARGRLEASAQGTLPLFAQGAALLLAVLSVLLPPVGLIGLAGLLWLLIGGRGREQDKYAGLRILR